MLLINYDTSIDLNYKNERYRVEYSKYSERYKLTGFVRISDGKRFMMQSATVTGKCKIEKSIMFPFYKVSFL